MAKPMCAAEQSDRFRKPFCDTEYEVFRRLPLHQRIVRFFGREDGHLVLQRHRCDLLTYLESCDLSIAQRLAWVLQIAEGIAHLHRYNVAWRDGHLANILVTDDDAVVLCDFGLSLLDPVDFDLSDCPSPPYPYIRPITYRAKFAQDIFSFGVICFALVEKRFPHCKNLDPDDEESVAAFRKHQMGEFELLTGHDALREVVQRCFTGEILSGKELVSALGGNSEFIWSKLFRFFPQFWCRGT